MKETIKKDFRQIYALTIKNVILQSRQYIANLFLVLTPLVCMLFIFVLQIVADNVLPLAFNTTTDTEGKRVNGIPLELTAVNFALSAAIFVTENGIINITDSSLPVSFEDLSIPNKIIVTGDDNELIETSLVELLYIINTTETEDIADDILYDALSEANYFLASFPFIGSYKFQNFTDDSIDFTVQTEKGLTTSLSGISLSSLTDIGTAHCSLVSFLYNFDSSLPCGNVYEVSLSNYINSRYIMEKTNGSKTVFTTVTQMPYYSKSSVFSLNVAESLGMFFYPLIMLLALPSIIYTIVIEKENRVKQMMLLMGMKERNYIVSTYVFKFLIFMVSVMIFYIIGLILQHRLFTQTNFLIIMLYFFGVGFSLVSLSFFLSSFINSSFVATLLSYVIVIFTPIAGIILNQYVLKKGFYQFKFLLIVPLFPITDVLFHATTECSKLMCLGLSSFATNYDFDIALFMLYFNAFWMFILAIYIEQISPKKWGVKKHPLFFLEFIFKYFRKENDNFIEPKDEDEDVMQMRKKIISGEINSGENGIIVKGLKKQFGWGKKKKVAVKQLFFNVRLNECLALLGPNGAGKTTSINILSGLYSQSSGTAIVNGHNISTEMDKVHKSQGLCPQFSIVWPELTLSEHLFFYTRMKGVESSMEKEHVCKILSDVGFHKERKELEETKFFRKVLSILFPKERQARQLSGGMKRRLSIGISLCGKPKVLLLDEPTTGLDPKNKREVWDVILKQKAERSVILTTHHLDEADALADVIGIMDHGELLCYGTSLHLKKRFAQTYKINLNYEKQESKEKIKQFISNNIAKNMKVLKDFRNSISLELESKSEEKAFSISNSFEMIENNKKDMGILDFEINQSSLEDVFINVITRKREKNENENKLKNENEKEKEEELDENENEKEHENENKNEEKSEKGDNAQWKEEISINEMELEEKPKPSPEESTQPEEKEEQKINENEKESKPVEESNMLIPKLQIEKRDGSFSRLSQSSVISSRDKKQHSSVMNFEYGDESGKVMNLNIKKNLFEEIYYYCKDVVVQTFVLFLKNLLLSLRDWMVSLGIVFSPLFVLVLLKILTLIAEVQLDVDIEHPDKIEVNVNQLPPCTGWSGKECFSFIYTTNGNDFGEEVMDSILANYNLNSSYNGTEFIKFESEYEMTEFIYNNPNITQTAISFYNVDITDVNVTELIPNLEGYLHVLLENIEDFPQLNISIENVTQFEEEILKILYGFNFTRLFEQIGNTTFLDGLAMYNLYFNNTGDSGSFLLEWKTIIDNNILLVAKGEKGKRRENEEVESIYSIKMENQRLPKPQTIYISGEMAIFTATGALFFTLIGMIMFVISLFKIVDEKENNLRMALEVLGMRKLSYFLSWFLVFTIYAALIALGSVIFGYILRFNVFMYSNPVVMFLNLFGFMVSLICFAFAFSPFFQSGKTALVFGFIFVGISFIANFFLANGVIVYLILTLNGWYKLIPIFLQILYSPFNFAKVFTDVVYMSVMTFSYITGDFVENEGYGWTTFFKEMEVPMLGMSVQGGYISFLFLVLNIFLYLMIFFYFDEIMKRNGYGGKAPWYFLTWKHLVGTFGKFFMRKIEIKRNVEDEYKNDDDDIEKEIQESYNFEEQKIVRVLGVKKNFKRPLRKPVRALKGVNFQMKEAMVLGLLGENGAGKSTCIKMIEGFEEIDGNNGNIFVNEKEVKFDKNLIRKTLGVCNQDDYLWGNLTAKEHAVIYSYFKGEFKKSKIDKILKDVNLYNVRDKMVKGFSGGMKRRLSCSLSFINKNTCTLLDEPSTGLDPLSVLQVWKLIEDKKNKCSIILTTHSLEEAERLSDKIVIFRRGSILCVGKILHLKKKFGSGYILKFTTDKKRFGKKLEDFVINAFPQAKLGTENAGNYLYSVEKVEDLIKGLKEVEKILNEKEEERIIQDFGCSHQSLEDVYLKVNEK